MSDSSPFSSVLGMYFVGTALAKGALEDPIMQKLLHTEDKYDIVITEVFYNEVFTLFARKFKAHYIGFSTIGPSDWTYWLSGNPQPYAYIPNLNYEVSNQMTFFQRAFNSFLCVYSDLLLYNFHIPNQEALAKKYFPDAPYLGDYLKDNVKMILLNSHISLKSAQPLVPSMIEIGGFHVDKPKPIPADLKKILDSAKNGVIYFSMGSNLKGKNLPSHVREAVLKAFGERKELILWKWEDPNLPGKPKNVIIQEWFPQSDLLG